MPDTAGTRNLKTVLKKVSQEAFVTPDNHLELLCCQLMSAVETMHSQQAHTWEAALTEVTHKLARTTQQVNRRVPPWYIGLEGTVHLDTPPLIKSHAHLLQPEILCVRSTPNTHQ